METRTGGTVGFVEELGRVIAALVLFAAIVLVLTLIAERLEPFAVRNAEGDIIEAGMLDWPGGEDIRVGDCLVDVRHWMTDEDVMTGVPCSEPHDFEVFARVDIPSDQAAPYPGEAEVEAHAQATCDARLAEYVGQPAASTELMYLWWEPSAGSWKDGDRLVECWLQSASGSKLEGSMKQADK